MSGVPVSINNLELSLNLKGENGKVYRLNLQSADGGNISLTLKELASEDGTPEPTVVDLTHEAAEAVTAEEEAAEDEAAEASDVEVITKKLTYDLANLTSSDDDDSFEEARAKVRAAVADPYGEKKRAAEESEEESEEPSEEEDESSEEEYTKKYIKPTKTMDKIKHAPVGRGNARPTRRSTRNSRRVVDSDSSDEFEEMPEMSQEFFSKRS